MERWTVRSSQTEKKPEPALAYSLTYRWNVHWVCTSIHLVRHTSKPEPLALRYWDLIFSWLDWTPLDFVHPIRIQEKALSIAPYNKSFKTRVLILSFRVAKDVANEKMLQSPGPSSTIHVNLDVESSNDAGTGVGANSGIGKSRATRGIAREWSLLKFWRCDCQRTQRFWWYLRRENIPIRWLFNIFSIFSVTMSFSEFHFECMMTELIEIGPSSWK